MIKDNCNFKLALRAGMFEMLSDKVLPFRRLAWQNMLLFIAYFFSLRCGLCYPGDILNTGKHSVNRMITIQYNFSKVLTRRKLYSGNQRLLSFMNSKCFNLRFSASSQGMKMFACCGHCSYKPSVIIREYYWWNWLILSTIILCYPVIQ